MKEEAQLTSERFMTVKTRQKKIALQSLFRDFTYRKNKMKKSYIEWRCMEDKT